MTNKEIINAFDEQGAFIGNERWKRQWTGWHVGAVDGGCPTGRNEMLWIIDYKEGLGFVSAYYWSSVEFNIYYEWYKFFLCEPELLQQQQEHQSPSARRAGCGIKE
jgi:hypothetical protein